MRRGRSESAVAEKSGLYKKKEKRNTRKEREGEKGGRAGPKRKDTVKLGKNRHK